MGREGGHGGMSVRGSGRHVEGETAGQDPCVGAAVLCLAEGPGAKECRGAALRLGSLRSAPWLRGRYGGGRGGAGPGGVGRWALPRHGPTRGGPSAAPLCCCPPPGQTAAARWIPTADPGSKEGMVQCFTVVLGSPCSSSAAVDRELVIENPEFSVFPSSRHWSDVSCKSRCRKQTFPKHVLRSSCFGSGGGEHKAHKHQM